MRIENNLHNKTNYNYNFKNNNHPNFTGFGIKSFNFGKHTSLLDKPKIKDEFYHISGKLGVDTKVLGTVLGEDAPLSRFYFLRRLTESYNAHNFSLEQRQKEDPAYLLHIAREVKKPQTEHYNIVQKSDMPFSVLGKIFENAETQKALGFVETMQHRILDGSKESANIIIKMLKSPHRKTYIKDTKDYVSYIKLNAKKETCVEDLDKMLTNGTFSRKYFDKKLRYENLMQQKHIRSVVGKYATTVEKHLTDENETFLKKFCDEFLPFRKKLTEKENIAVLDMFKTTTKENLPLRSRIIEKFRYEYASAKSKTSDVMEMQKLFNRMDADKHCAGFVEKSLNDGIKIENLGNFNAILDIVPASKAEIFHKNISRIVRYTTPEERKSALLTEIENPFFPIKRVNESRKREVITYTLHKDTKFERLSKFLENKLNKYKYNKAIKNGTDIEPQGTKTIFAPEKDFIHIPTISETITAPARTEKEPKLNLVRTLKLSPEARKLKVKSDINDVIQKKLGHKTYENQTEKYGIKATAIRLKLLPEIFDSISATRKMQKIEGKRPNVENKDALRLYEKIQGKNRKLVRYMLKQTDESGNRIFNIKEISALIDETEAKITQDKKLNPQYRAADAKAQYEEIFQNMVAEYGKLKRSKKAA